MWFDDLLDKQFQRRAPTEASGAAPSRALVEQQARMRRQRRLRLQVRAVVAGSPSLTRR